MIIVSGGIFKLNAIRQKYEIRCGQHDSSQNAGLIWVEELEVIEQDYSGACRLYVCGKNGRAGQGRGFSLTGW